MFKPFFPFVSLCMMLFSAWALAQQTGPFVMYISEDGSSFEADLYRLGENEEWVLSVNEQGDPLISGVSAGMLEYSNYIGEEYGKLIRAGELELQYYHDRYHAGKLARMGSVELEYYDSFLGDARAGKLKRVGAIELEYYLEIDGEMKKGRISSIGGTRVDYYYGGSLDGKILSLGKVRFRFFQGISKDVRSGKIVAIEGEEPGWNFRLKLN